MLTYSLESSVQVILCRIKVIECCSKIRGVFSTRCGFLHRLFNLFSSRHGTFFLISESRDQPFLRRIDKIVFIFQSKQSIRFGETKFVANNFYGIPPFTLAHFQANLVGVRPVHQIRFRFGRSLWMLVVSDSVQYLVSLYILELFCRLVVDLCSLFLAVFVFHFLCIFVVFGNADRRTNFLGLIHLELGHASQEIESEFIASLSSLSAFSYAENICLTRDIIGDIVVRLNKTLDVLV
mmetsp:Transcript_6236/g.15174  ORF Transcript_6236/g.15174 Transcript_6236/m.15174 type:complete len:237 (+) Transcript_6236:1369-2079(+)